MSVFTEAFREQNGKSSLFFKWLSKKAEAVGESAIDTVVNEENNVKN